MRKKILVVEDDRDYQAVLRLMLQRAGYETEECRFGSNALPRLLAKDIDLVMLDYMMPDEKGDEISHSIKSMETLKKLPILIVTGHHELSEEFFKGMGAQEVLYKPVNYDELVDKVKKCLKD
ncbi:MAG: hypothetical protein A3C47_03595 [Omnitrophica bacterium RIFCSPHIGHO2_02_FULL_51_18]|nr:MAG: hypothetical protein A3C47_03595 [Omnitrophica bacterium RIFCSPHIGHO2_02_FULL_51_18]